MYEKIISQENVNMCITVGELVKSGLSCQSPFVGEKQSSMQQRERESRLRFKIHERDYISQTIKV